MKTIEDSVIEHYENSNLLSRILLSLKKSGVDINNLQPNDLAPFEEFHIGGRKATEYLVEKLALQAGSHVLDIGCGIGGAARYITALTGSQVTGIDLTPQYIAAAKALSKRVRLDDKLHFETASALAMPFDNASFDAAITLHVAMNINDRISLYSEIARIIKTGAVFGIFDVMKKNNDDLSFPVPWAQSSTTSYLTTADETCGLLANAGFIVSEVEDRTEFALEFFAQSLAAQANGTTVPGISLLMGNTASIKLANVLDNIKKDRIAPVQIIATRN